MESKQLGSGDNSNNLKSSRSPDIDTLITCELHNTGTVDESRADKIYCTSQMIEENETKLKERIAQCKNVIDSLKFELSEEKSKFEKESKKIEHPSEFQARYGSSSHQVCSTDTLKEDLTLSCNVYSACIDSKLHCDESLIEYEKQLQKYQNTLNMAQIEKKNAIRRQMLAKAYKLKLLEIENQCNVELLRVKQSLQCLEPLKIIVNKWKTNPDTDQCFDGFDLIPRYPELNANSGIAVESFNNLDTKATVDETEDCVKD